MGIMLLRKAVPPWIQRRVFTFTSDQVSSMNAQNVATSLIMCGAFFCFKRKSYVFCRATQCLETPSQDLKNFFPGFSLAENGVDASAPQHLIHCCRSGNDPVDMCCRSARFWSATWMNWSTVEIESSIFQTSVCLAALDMPEQEHTN